MIYLFQNNLNGGMSIKKILETLKLKLLFDLKYALKYSNIQILFMYEIGWSLFLQLVNPAK